MSQSDINYTERMLEISGSDIIDVHANDEIKFVFDLKEETDKEIKVAYSLLMKALNYKINKADFSSSLKHCFESWVYKQILYFYSLKSSERELLNFYTTKGHLILNKRKDKWDKHEAGLIRKIFMDIYKQDVELKSKQQSKTKEYIKQLIVRIKELIMNAPLTECDFLVYRGTKSDYFKDKRYFADGKFITPTTLSTSLSLSIALDFVGQECCMNVIHVKKGCSCLLMIENTIEIELVFPEYTRLDEVYENKILEFHKITKYIEDNRKIKTFFWEINEIK